MSIPSPVSGSLRPWIDPELSILAFRATANVTGIGSDAAVSGAQSPLAMQLPPPPPGATTTKLGSHADTNFGVRS
jgi:hypothetical protein